VNFFRRWMRSRFQQGLIDCHPLWRYFQALLTAPLLEILDFRFQIHALCYFMHF
jgi:hypothetical protein